MEISEVINSLNWLREDIIGRNIYFETPYGKKPLVYADYTASGRGFAPIEKYLNYLLNFYANTHTFDDFTGKSMSKLLHEAEDNIKKIVNAGPSGKIIFTGTGATGAIVKLQQILGVYWPPATKSRLDKFLSCCAHNNQNSHQQDHKNLLRLIDSKKPIVFVGPYEHHSNEIMWRQSLCEIIETPLDSLGELDLIALEKIISNPLYSDRPKIGSFSAASNVSGIKTPVYEVAKILHRHKAIACFDFAASAPYVDIDMNKDNEAYFDAIFLSPHKFLGGPASSGLLIFNELIYKKNLPPTIAAGGTVDYVTIDSEKYTDDIEEREKPGTPGILQAIKASLVFQLKEKVGTHKIELIEKHYFNLFYKSFKNNPNVIIYGPTVPEKKVNIVSFNIKHNDRILHPKFFTKLLNDLFGIQTRAGCSCAGPYGHVLLNINKEASNQYLCAIESNRFGGLKPGWIRLNLHYAFSECEINYIIDALNFIAPIAYKFLPLYIFDFFTGEWICRDEQIEYSTLDLSTILNGKNEKPDICTNLTKELENTIKEVETLLEKLNEHPIHKTFDKEIEKVMFFYVVNSKNYNSLNGI